MRYSRSPVLVCALAGAALAAVSAAAQSISTGFSGTLTTLSSPQGGGGFFSVTALDPQGITIDSIEVHAGTGTAVVGFLYRPGGYQGFEQDIASWLHLGEERFASAGAGNPSPTAIGGLYIPPGQTYSFRQVQMASTGRLHTEAQLSGGEVIVTAGAQLNRGSAQTNGYIFSTVTSPRGWNGTINYTPGGSAPSGACCLPDGTCALLRADDCRLGFGLYAGDNTACAGVQCAQPAPGACCLPDGTCTTATAADCGTLGGFFSGYGTVCGAEPCGKLSTPFLGPTVGAGMFNGHFFTVTAGDRDVVVNGLDINCSASAGTNITFRMHTRPDAWEGFTDNPFAWSVHAEVAAVSAGSEQPTRVRLPLGRELRIPANQTIAVRIGAAGGSMRYSTTSFTPFVEDQNLRLDFGATQSNLWSTVSSGRTWSGNLYYTLAPAGPAACYANCDGSTTAPILNVADFSCFLTKFAGGDSYANCDISTAMPVLNVADFTCFLQRFAAGCP